MDATANALRPRDSQAYATLDAIQDHLSGKSANRSGSSLPARPKTKSRIDWMPSNRC